MSLLASDTIYRDLKQKGLELTPCIRIKVPEPELLKTGLMKKLTSVIRKPQTAAPAPLKLVQIMNSAFLAIRNQAIFIYKYTYNEGNKKIEVEHDGTLNLPYYIEQVFQCDSKHIQDKDFPLIVKYKNGCGYLNFDLKESTIEERNFLKIPNLLNVAWINDHECLLADENNLHHYTIVQGQFKLKICKPLNLIIKEGEVLKKIWILPHVDEQQDSIIPIFYTTIPSRQTEFIYPPMKLKAKEILRTLDGDLADTQQQSDYILETQSLQYRDQFHIISVGDYYCLQLAQEVLIMKKKYDKYMLLDNMMEIMNEYKVKLNKKGIIVSIGEKLLQLNCIHFADPKCSSRICDVIQFPEQLAGYDKYFRQVWPIINYKQFTLIFVFINENEITLSGLVKLEPMQKMLILAKRDPKQSLEIIQDMALNLGIARKDFYLKLWTTSKKQNADIYKFLIPCYDVKSIKKQLKSTLKTRTIQVSEMLKILQKISEINLQNLKSDLNQKNLKEYVKNDFLRKKIKLNEVNKMLDHRIFEKIYSSSILNIFEDIVQEQLDPIQPVYDPLHLNENYQPIKELKSLKNVFQEFKVVILEQYKTFLIAFLAKFPKKILEVLQTFSFLLPNHPFEIQVQKPSKTNEPILIDPKTNDTVQELWFQTVKVCEWQEQITKQRILKSLFHDFQTSKIIETVDEFYNSLYGRQNRRWKHGVITANLDEYRAKLKMLSGIQLYLDVCQFANQLSVAENGDQKISQKILAILEEKNKLGQPDLHFCRLYANMHYFMLKNKIIPKSKLEISSLISLKPENLVAIFFLQNKQRKEHIFNDFKNLYEDKNQFKQILQKFVQSENCSRIQLEILMKEVKKKGEKFQKQNQDIIEILISGICQKVEIRQTLLLLDVDEDGDEENGTEIDEIQLNKTLALKVNRVKRLKLCKDIFKSFGLEKLTYKQLLDLENDNEIFKLLLAKYNQIMMKKSEDEQFVVSIEDEEKISLENPKNLITILIYLQENIYYSAKAFDILIIVGLELIQSRYFKTVTSIINDNNAFETLGVDRNEFVQVLTIKALDVIYLEPEIVYDEATKQQIMDILNIDEEESPFKIREKAKLDLAEIFVGWELEVHPSDIHSIATAWKDVDLRNDFMEQLIVKYVDKLTFATLQEFYRLLEIIDNQMLEVNLLNKAYTQFCDFFAKKLLQKKRFSQAAEVISFLMQIEGQKIDYPMLAQVYVQSVIEIYPENQEVGRKLIQLFSQTYGTSLETNITELLQSYFSSADLVLKVWEQDRNPLILINYKYCYQESQKINQKINCEVSLDDLWEISKKQSTNPAELYYNYFFLTMSLTNPKTGFEEIVGISYNLQKITNMLLGDLNYMFDKDENLWFVNYPLLLAQFTYSGVLSEAAYLLNIPLQRDNRQQKFDMLIKELRDHRTEHEKNEIILNILNKLKVQVLNKGKRNSRRDRSRKKLREIVEKQLEKDREQTQVNIEPVEIPEDRPEVFLNWKKVQQEKKYISSVSQYIMSQKDLIDQVFESNADACQVKQTIKNDSKEPRNRILEGLFLPLPSRFNDKNEGTITALLRNKKYTEVSNKYSYKEVVEEIEKMFAGDDDNDYRQIIQILDQLDIGDPEKRNYFRLARIYLDYLPNNIRRGLFSLDFLLNSLPEDLTSEDKKSALVYSELQSNLTKLSPMITPLEIKEIANLFGGIFNSVEYSGLVYYQQLLYVGQVGVFDSSSALMAQECIYGLMGSCPEIICQRYQAIIDTMADKETRIFVKQILAKVLGEKQNYSDIAELIKKYEGHH